MSEAASNSEPGPIGKAVPSHMVSGGKKRYLLAAFFSALIPGAGQLFQGHRRKGILLLLIFVVLVSSVWPFRLPRFFAAFILICLVWLVLSLYATCAALLQRTNPIEPRTSRWWLLAVPLLTYLGFNVVFTPLFLFANFRALKFNSSAMENTLRIGDQFIIDEAAYHDHPIARNDLVVVGRLDYQTVKRVIAIGGDTLEATDREVTVNGQRVTEPFIRHTLAPGTNRWMDNFGPLTVPAGKYFVMGDNRAVSLDSRSSEFGLLDAQAITGRPLYIYRSPHRARVGKKLN